MKGSIRNDIVDFILSDSVTIDRLQRYKIYGTLFSHEGVRRMTPLIDKSHWMSFLSDLSGYKIITYICDYHHSFELIKMPKVEPPWSCIEEFIVYCERTNVEPDQINQMIKILSKGFPICLVDLKNLL